MQRSPGFVLALALALGACQTDAAIVVEVTWDPAALDSTVDTLRIYVGTATADAAASVTNPGSTAIALAGLASPYRYLLQPGGDLDAIGDLQVAAALTAGPSASPIAFAAAPAPIGFAAGEVRTIVLAPTAHNFAVSGGALECVTWAATAGARELDRAIGASGDNDCDLSANAVDCQPFNPQITGEDFDGDQAVCDDCLEGTAPVMIDGWSVAPAAVFPGQTEGGFRIAAGVPDTVTCVHVDFDCSGTCGADRAAGDSDGSKTDACGKLGLGAEPLVCPMTPSDCDEDVPGDTAAFGDPEVCSGADESCDRRVALNLPCPLQGPQGCMVGRQDCDDRRGRFRNCASVPFPHPLDADTCGLLGRVEGCRFADDPLKCAGGGRETCDVATSGPGCLDERVTLPGIVGTDGCDWRVLGGVDHAEWVIGFGTQDTPNAPPVEATTACGPVLIARAVHPSPSPRTVMILGRTAVGATVLVGFVTFRATEDANACDGALACAPLPFSP